MTNTQWETVQLQQNDSNSPFLKWGDMAGQTITGVVLDYTPDGGKDFDGNACPRIELAITPSNNQQGCYNIQEGRQVQLQPGDRLTWQGNTPARLANGLKAANPTRGDLIQFSHEGTYRTEKGTGKDIQTKIARGAGMEYIQRLASPAQPQESKQWSGTPMQAPQPASSPPF